MSEETMARAKKPAKRVNYNVSLELLAGLNTVAKFEHRTDTAQLEIFIREGLDKWLAEHPDLINEYEQEKEHRKSYLEGSDKEGGNNG